MKMKLSKQSPKVKSAFTTLHNGEHLFTVKSMVKGVSTDEKTKGAPQAKIEMFLYALNDMGHKKPVGVVLDTLVRHTSTESNVCQFFKAIGALDHAQAITPNWDKILGAAGRAMFYPETCEGKTIMKIKRYLDPEEVLMRISA